MKSESGSYFWESVLLEQNCTGAQSQLLAPLQLGQPWTEFLTTACGQMEPEQK